MRATILALGALSVAHGAPLTITNFNMESAPAARTDGAINSAVATGWTYTNVSGTSTFTFNPTTTTRYYNDAAFLDAGPTGGASGTMAGPNFTGIFGSTQNSSGYIQQTLAATVTANTVYTLTVALGHRTVDSGNAAIASPVTLELLAGGVSLASATFDPASGIWAAGADVWADAALVLTTDATPTQIGQPLTVRFTKVAVTGTTNSYTDIDNVRLDAVQTTPPAPVDLKLGLVGFFPFEQDFINRSGWVDGAPVNGALAGRPGGVAGNAMELRPGGGSSNDCMRVAIGYGGTVGADNLGTNFTVSAWYNLDPSPSGSASGRYFVFEGDGSAGSGFDVSYGLRDLSLGTAGINDGQVFTDTTSTSPAGSNSLNIADAAIAGWHHVLQTYSSVGGVTTIRTYIDGVETASLTPQTSAIVDGGMNFGAARTAVTDRGLDGMIDEVALWSRVLTIDEIAAVRARGLAGQPVVEPPVIASFSASASTVTPGQEVELSWNVSGAETVTITPDIGTVAATGSTRVTLSSSASFLLTATAADGVTDLSRVTVNVSRGPIAVYLLGGQSNMQGVGPKTELVPLGLQSIPEVLLFHSSGTSSTGGANTLMTVRACGFDSNSFGPEIGFADEMRKLQPGTAICLIKHAVGGSSLQVKWNPGANNADTADFGPEYTTFVATVNAGLAALRAQDYEPKIVGMLWQQGEQDSKEGLNTSGDGDAQSANDYGTNLKHFVARVRGQFAADIAPTGLRFVLGQVTPYYPEGGSLWTAYPGRNKIRQAQLDADEASGATLSITNTATVPTNDVEFPVHEQVVDGFRDDDEAHFTGPSLLLLGRRMAYRMLQLAPVGYADWSSSHGLLGTASDDDDGDGAANLLEYLGGTLPDNAGSVSRPQSAMEEIDGGNYLTLTVPTSLNVLDASWEAQVSTDLIHWNQGTAPVFLGAEYPSPGIVVRKYRAPLPADGFTPQAFLRMAASP